MTAVVVNTSGEVLIEEFATDAGDPGLEELPAGEYQMRFWAYVSDASGDTRLVFRVYRRETDTTETEIFSLESPEIDALTESYYTQLAVLTTPYTALNPNR